MRLRKPLTLALGIAMLLAPVALLAADPVTEPAATTATSAPTSAAAPAAATPAASSTVAATSEANAPAPVGLDKPKGLDQCDMATGSIIRPKMKDGCKSTGSLPTRTYTKEDIDRTGEFDLNEALRKLDPSFR